MSFPYPYPKTINFDGNMYPKVQQGSYWPGFRVRFMSGSDFEDTSLPLAQVRTAPIDRNGLLVATMRTIPEVGGWTHFDMPANVTATLPTGTLLFYDVDITDSGGQQRTPIIGRIDVVPEVSRNGDSTGADPGPGTSPWITQAEADLRYRQLAVPLVDIDIPALIARDTEVADAVATETSRALAADSDRRVQPGPSGYGPSVVAGWSGNGIATDLGSTVVLGGGQPGYENLISGSTVHVNTSTSNGAPVLGSNAHYSVIGGGYDNVVNGLASAITGFHCYISSPCTHGTISGGSIHAVKAGTYCTIAGGTAHTIDSVTGGGSNTISGGNTNTISGTGTVASTVAGGSLNQLSASNGTVGGGSGNIAGGAGVTIAGGGLNGSDPTTSYASIGGGYTNTVTGSAFYATIGGGSTNQASANNATIGGGFGHTASASGATIGGGTSNQATGTNSTVAGGSANVAVGTSATIAGGTSNSSATGSTYATVGGGFSNTVTTAVAAATIGGGSLNQVTGANGTVGGGSNNVGGGSGATIGGGGTNSSATGTTYATIAGGSTNTVTGTANYATVAGGVTNTVSGSQGTVGGGQGNTVSAAHATVPGGFTNTASASYSVAAGRESVANIEGQWAHADGKFTAAGDAQRSGVVLRRQTTDATSTLLGVGGVGTTLVVPVNTSWLFTYRVVGKRTDTQGDAAMWEIKGLVTRGAGAPSLAGTPSGQGAPLFSAGGGSAWTANLAVGGSTVSCNVVGAAAVSVNWVADVALVQVTG